MKVIERILRINSQGQLLQFSHSLKRWESIYSSWSWDDIHPDYLEESKENYNNNNNTI